MRNLCCIMLFAMLSTTAPALARGLNTVTSVLPSVSNYLNVVLSPGGAAMMNWQLGSPGGTYTVSITNMNTGLLEQQFNTTNTSATVYNLKNATTYEFRVQKGAEFVIVLDGNP